MNAEKREQSIVKAWRRRVSAGLTVGLGLGWFVVLAGGVRADEAALPGNTPLDGTPAEVAKFYGPVLRHHARVRNHMVLEGTVLDGDLYGKNGFIIRAVFTKGRCVLLEYTRATGPLTLADVNPLLTINAGNSSWQPGKDNTEATRFYHRLDDKAIAHWSTENDGSLLVSVEDGNTTLGGGLMQGG